MSKKIYFKLGGGLGNQIFQYAAVTLTAVNQGASPIFDIRGLESAHHGQKALITNLNLPGNFVSSFNLRSIFWRVMRKVTKNRARMRELMGIYVSDSLGYEDFLSSKQKKYRYLEGFFITHKFLGALKESKILPEICPNNPSTWFVDNLSSLKKKRVCGIHLRRGDYLDSWEHYGVLSEIYYMEALEKLSPSLQIEEFWIFTDSPKSAEEFIQRCGINNYRIVLQPDYCTDAESFVLLSSCTAVICANSTFSISASIFSLAEEVIVPETFYRSITVPLELYPDSWIKVNSAWLDFDKVAKQ